MQNEQNKYAELKATGIKCDNQTCDYRDDSVQEADYPAWVNKPCPKCGENLLTEEDYNTALMMHGVMDFLNTLSPEELKQISSGVDMQALLKDDVFKGTAGLEHLQTNELVTMQIDIHNGFKVVEIKPNQGENPERSVATEA